MDDLSMEQKKQHRKCRSCLILLVKIDCNTRTGIMKIVRKLPLNELHVMIDCNTRTGIRHITFVTFFAGALIQLIVKYSSHFFSMKIDCNTRTGIQELYCL
ncbi:hypothetical protein R6Q59_027494 [Mikania micrantha]